ncbi:putative transcriptional regulator tpeD [Castanea sativa]|uniref:putative transcriptional regulator tpeD n=1 Tax=Castanea sativa TaxID=21020 RepID=UPI003F64BBD6
MNIESEKSTEAVAPLWKYVTKLEKAAAGGGNVTFKCDYCEKTFKGSYSRVKAHLLKLSNCGIQPCGKVGDEYLNEMQKLEDAYEESTRRLKKPKLVSLLSDSPSSPHLGPNLSSTATNSLIARTFYSAGLPFHFAKNPYWIEMIKFACNNNLTGYIPPGYNKLRTTLLHKEKVHIEKLLKSIKDTWKERGLSIVSDGWTDPQKRPLINFMATSEKGPLFIKSIDGTKEYKDKHFISDLFLKVIGEVGHTNVVQIITDNASVMKAAGSLVEAEYPHIFWSPCVVHTLNLALKNICAPKNSLQNEVAYNECNWIAQVSDEATFIRIFITNHSMRLAIFNSFSPLKLLAVAETRFASIIIMLKRLFQVKQHLRSMVISEEWMSYREDDVGKAQTVRDYVLNDLWWDKVAYILRFTGPIYEMLRVADTDAPILHKVYEMWDSMIENVKKEIYKQEGKEEYEESPFYDVVHAILIERYYTNQWIEEGRGRVAPHKDAELSTERNKCLKRFFPDIDDRKNVTMEFGLFSGIRAYDDDNMDDRWVLDPILWWLNYGSRLPMLQTLALKLLGQPCSSSCAERNWSTYGFIHCMRRNRITPKRAEDLVFVHSNLRLLSRRREEYTKGNSKKWDISGDTWNEPFGGPGLLEIAYLTLDEPEMEISLVENDDYIDDDDDVVVL